MSTPPPLPPDPNTPPPMPPAPPPAAAAPIPAEPAPARAPTPTEIPTSAPTAAATPIAALDAAAPTPIAALDAAAPTPAPPKPAGPIAATAIVPPKAPAPAPSRAAGAAGWKFATFLFLFLLLAVAGSAGYYIYILRKNPPAPAAQSGTRAATNIAATSADPALPDALTAAKNELEELREKIHAAETAKADALAQIDTKNKRIESLEKAAGNAPPAAAQPDFQQLRLENDQLKKQIARAATPNPTPADAAAATDDLKAQLAAANSKAEAALRQVQNLTSQLDQAQATATGNADLDKLRAKLADTQAAADAARRQIESDKTEIASLKDQVAKAAAAPAGNADADKLRTQLADANAQLEKQKTADDLAMKQASAQHNTELAAANSKADAAAKQVHDLTRQLEQTKAAPAGNADADKLRAQLADADAALDAAKKDADAARKQTEADKADLAALKDQLAKASAAPASTAPADNADAAKLRAQLEETKTTAAAERDKSKADLEQANKQIADLQAKVAVAGANDDKALAAKYKEQVEAWQKSAFAAQAELADKVIKLDAAQKQLQEISAATQAAPPVLTGDAAKLAGVIKDNRRRFASSAKIESVAVTHNVTVDNAPGMQIKVTYTVNGLSGLRGMLVIWPLDDAGKPITAAKDAPAALHDASGKLVTLTRFAPTLDAATFNGDTLFIPYSAFPRFTKATNCKLRVVVYSGDMSADESQYKLATDESQSFQIGGE